MPSKLVRGTPRTPSTFNFLIWGKMLISRKFSATFLLVFFLIFFPSQPTHSLVLPLVPLAVVGAVALGALVASQSGVSLHKMSIPTAADISSTVQSQVQSLKIKATIAKTFADNLLGTAIFGKTVDVDLNAAALWQYVKDHLPDFPTLGPIWTAGHTHAVSSVVPVMSSSFLASSLHIGGGTGTLAHVSVDCSGGLYDDGARAFGTSQTNYYNYVTLQVTKSLGGVVQQTTSPSLAIVSTGYTVRYDVCPPITADVDVPNLPQLASAVNGNPAAYSDVVSAATANPAIVESPPPVFTPTELVDMSNAANAAFGQRRVTATADALALNPTDPGLIAAHDAAVQAATLSQSVADNTPITPTDTVPPAAVPAPPAALALDFSPFMDLQGILASKFPFNLIGHLKGYFNILMAEPIAPSFTMSAGFGKTATFDMSLWSPAASMFRGFMVFFFNASCIYAIVRRWG